MSRVLSPESGPIRGRMWYLNANSNDGKGWGFYYNTLQDMIDDNKAGTQTFFVREPFIGVVLIYHGRMMIPEFKRWTTPE